MKYHICLKFLAVLLCACALLTAVGSGVCVGAFLANDLYAMDENTVMGHLDDYVDNSLCSMAHLAAQQYAAIQSGMPEGLWEERYERNYLSQARYILLDETGRVLSGTYVGEDYAVFREFPALSTTYPRVVSVRKNVDGRAEQEPIATTGPFEGMNPTEPARSGNTVPSIPPEDPPEQFDDAISWWDEEGEQWYAYYIRYEESPAVTVRVYLLEGTQAGELLGLRAVGERLWQLRYWMFAILAGSLLVFAAGFVYLCCAAGRRPGETELRPSGLNAMPLDVYSLLCGGGAVLLAAFWVRLMEYGEESLFFIVALSVMDGLLISLLVVALLFAWAAQMKMGLGYMWAHSLTGWAFRMAWKLAKWLWKAVRGVFRWIGRTLGRFFGFLGRLFGLLPLTWQWLLGAAALFLSALIGYASHGPVILWTMVVWTVIVGYGLYGYGTISKKLREMRGGNLTDQISTQYLFGTFRETAENMNALSGVVDAAAKEKMRSERMKAELITNVSHDIKTPLTSIINYVDLLRKDHTPEQGEEYLEVLSRQSQRMKKLLEDLIEMSKASTGNLRAEITRVDGAEAVNQALGEFSDKLAATRITPVFPVPAQPVWMMADGRLVWRVLSNLLSNVVKYAQPDTRLYVEVSSLQGQVMISLKNISRDALNVSSQELMERFVRGDSSRNTEGSGLGLNIAQSLMELQHGSLKLLVDGDLFKVVLLFPAGK